MNAVKDATEPQSGEEQLSQEAVLKDYVERLKKFPEGRRALHLRVSQLRPQHQRRHHLRVAQQSFEPLIQGFEGALFKLFNNDLVVTLKGAEPERIDAVVAQLRQLFDGDPLLAAERDPRAFAVHYDLEHDLTDLVELCHGMEQTRQDRERELSATGGARPDPKPALALDPKGLWEIEAAIVQADHSNFSRRQAICALVPGSKPEPVFREIYISIADLGEMLLPGRGILANRWLFQYLTQTLDQRVLAMLAARDGILTEGHISINLNVSSATSREFLKLDEALIRSDRAKVLIEIQLIDAFADLSRFAFARDFLRSKGYRVCLDGCSHLSLQHFDREALGVDFVKVAWGDELADHLAGPQGADLAKAIARMGSQRVILNRCGSAQALEVGRTLGIHLYQGYHIDALLAEEAQPNRPVLEPLGELVAGADAD